MNYCQPCSKSFKTPASLSTHKYKFHSDNNRPQHKTNMYASNSIELPKKRKAYDKMEDDYNDIAHDFGIDPHDSDSSVENSLKKSRMDNKMESDHPKKPYAVSFNVFKKQIDDLHRKNKTMRSHIDKLSITDTDKINSEIGELKKTVHNLEIKPQSGSGDKSRIETLEDEIYSIKKQMRENKDMMQLHEREREESDKERAIKIKDMQTDIKETLNFLTNMSESQILSSSKINKIRKLFKTLSKYDEIDDFLKEVDVKIVEMLAGSSKDSVSAMVRESHEYIQTMLGELDEKLESRYKSETDEEVEEMDTQSEDDSDGESDGSDQEDSSVNESDNSENVPEYEHMLGGIKRLASPLRNIIPVS